jgi:hypothetical protein
MTHCPVCKLLMTPRTVAGETVLGCDECGRTWLAEDALKRLVHAGYDALCELDQAFLAESPAAGGDATPPCPDCGGPLQAHGVGHAPDLHLLDCAVCHRVLLTHGQATALASHLPAPAPPPAPRPGAAMSPVECFSRADPVRPAGTSPVWWPERPVGCPWPPWFVFGMPFWAAMAMVVATGLLVAPPPHPVFHSYARMSGPGLNLTFDPPTVTMLGLLFWPFHTLIFLSFFFSRRYSSSGPDLSDLNALGTWLVMLRVVACADLAWAVIYHLLEVFKLDPLGVVAIVPVFLVAGVMVINYGIQNLAPE